MMSNTELKETARRTFGANRLQFYFAISSIGLVKAVAVFLAFAFNVTFHVMLVNSSTSLDYHMDGPHIAIFLAMLLVIDLITAPLSVCSARFSLASLRGPASLPDSFRDVTANYPTVVMAIFLRDVLIFLGSFLVLPSIYFLVRYATLPYVLADDPRLSLRQALSTSSGMAKGRKFALLKLRLSFVGWNILSVITLFLLQPLYLMPYRSLAIAAFYQQLAQHTERPQQQAYMPVGPSPSIHDVPTPQGYQPTYGRPTLR